MENDFFKCVGTLGKVIVRTFVLGLFFTALS